MDDIATSPQLVDIQKRVVEEVQPHGIKLFLRQVVTSEGSVLSPEEVSFVDGRNFVFVTPDIGGWSTFTNISTYYYEVISSVKINFLNFWEVNFCK